MTVVRELVTQLRYEIDDTNLRKYQNTKVPAPGSGTDWKRAPRRVDAVGAAFGRLRSLMLQAAAAFSVVKLAGIADEWASIRGRVGLVTDGVQEQEQALAGLFEIAQKTGQEYVATAGVFQASQRNAKALGMTLAENLELTEAIGNAMTIGGGSSASQQAALTQLGQALGSGVLRGEELNSILEQAPRLAQAIAEAFDVAVGDLKTLGEQGKLTSKALARGLIKQLPKLREEFERIPPTFGRSMTRLSNELGRWVDKLQRSLGLAEKFDKVVRYIIDNVGDLARMLGAIAGAAGLMKIASIIRSIGAGGGILAALGGPAKVGMFLARLTQVLTIATAIYYVFDDIAVWFQGGDSMLGRIIGGFQDWKWLVDAVVGGLTFIKDMFGASAQSLGDWIAKWGTIGAIVLGVVTLLGIVPTMIVAGIIAIASAFNFLRQNWDWFVADFRQKISDIGGWFSAMWDGVLAKAQAIWSTIKNLASDAVPDWAKTAFRAVTGAGAAAGAWLGDNGGRIASAAVRPGGAGPITTVVTQAPVVNVTATNANPPAVAAAAEAGTRQAMRMSAMVPSVEVPR